MLEAVFGDSRMAAIIVMIPNIHIQTSFINTRLLLILGHVIIQDLALIGIILAVVLGALLLFLGLLRIILIIGILIIVITLGLDLVPVPVHSLHIGSQQMLLDLLDI